MARPVIDLDTLAPFTGPDGETLIMLHVSKRELIAALALQGLLQEWPLTSDHESLARDAVKFADALIKELDRP